MGLMEDWSFCSLILGLGKSRDFYGFSSWSVSGVLRGCVLVAVIVVVIVKERGTLSEMFCVSEEGRRRNLSGYSWVLFWRYVALEWLKMTVVWCFRVIVKRMRTFPDLGCWRRGWWKPKGLAEHLPVVSNSRETKKMMRIFH